MSPENGRTREGEAAGDQPPRQQIGGRGRSDDRRENWSRAEQKKNGDLGFRCGVLATKKREAGALSNLNP